MATTEPSADNETDQPLKSPAASPSMSDPRCTQVAISSTPSLSVSVVFAKAAVDKIDTAAKSNEANHLP